jgi:hypothetical protein
MAIIFQPFDEFWVPVFATTIYLIVVFVLRGWMKDRQPYKLNTLLGLHNVLLCFISICMTVGFIHRVFLAAEHGLLGIYCGSTKENNDGFIFWSTVFYVSKYYELLDTVRILTDLKLNHPLLSGLRCFAQERTFLASCVASCLSRLRLLACKHRRDYDGMDYCFQQFFRSRYYVLLLRNAGRLKIVLSRYLRILVLFEKRRLVEKIPHILANCTICG